MHMAHVWYGHVQYTQSAAWHWLHGTGGSHVRICCFCQMESVGMFQLQVRRRAVMQVLEVPC